MVLLWQLYFVGMCVVNYISCNHILRWIWKTWGWKSAFQHDAYSCETFNNKGISIGWPTQRLIEPNNFVASPVNENITLLEKCPLKCRRRPEWEYC